MSGNTIKDLRRKAGLYQSEAAEMLGLGIRGWQRLEDGDCHIGIGYVSPLARIFGVSSQDVLHAIGETEAIDARVVESWTEIL